jgi:hypothetical protein
MLSITLFILAVYAIYALVIWGLVFVVRKLGITRRWAFSLAFMIFAVCLGIWTAKISHQDSSVIFNFPGVLFGEAIYRWSIQLLGDPHSFQAHYTIPWLLRVPQVFVLTSILLWGLLGLVVQLIYNWCKNTASLQHGKGFSNVKAEEESL